VPVINALTDRFHPCQALAFALTLDETMPRQRHATVVFVGDGNNVCASLMVACAKLGHHFTLACPPGYEPPRDLLNQAGDIARRNNASVSVSHDPYAAVARASFIYTDVWTSMGQENQKEQRQKAFAPFQVNAQLLAKAPDDALVSHCLPAHRGEEITDDVLDSKRCRALDEAENRLHVQKAVIVHLLS
jgi:ornithine carbamoyltransferase